MTPETATAEDGLSQAFREIARRIEAARAGAPAGVEFSYDFLDEMLFLDRLYVPRAFQRAGVGSRLLLEALSAADEAGVPVLLVADPTDEPGDPDTFALVRLYRKLGFVEESLSNDEAVVMRRVPGTPVQERGPADMAELEAAIASLPEYGAPPAPR